MNEISRIIKNGWSAFRKNSIILKSDMDLCLKKKKTNKQKTLANVFCLHYINKTDAAQITSNTGKMYEKHNLKRQKKTV